MPSDYIDIVFDGPPAPESGRFVEVEDSSGKSISFGEWVEREDGYWALRIESPTATPTDDALVAEGYADPKRQAAAAEAMPDSLTTPPTDAEYGCSTPDDCANRTKAECEWCMSPAPTGAEVEELWDTREQALRYLDTVMYSDDEDMRRGAYNRVSIHIEQSATLRAALTKHTEREESPCATSSSPHQSQDSCSGCSTATSSATGEHTEREALLEAQNAQMRACLERVNNGGGTLNATLTLAALDTEVKR